MGKLEMGRYQAPIESPTRSRKNLKEYRKEALLVLKRQVLAELISDPTELPHWALPENNDGLIQFSRDNKDLLAQDRTKIIEREIAPRKKFLKLPPFEKRQHRYVRNKMAEFAEEIGVPVKVVMGLADAQMNRAVEIQKKSSKKPSTKPRQQQKAA